MIPRKASGYLLILLMAMGALIPYIPNASAMTATGGTITTSGGYTIHTFTTSGTFNVTSGSGGTVEVLVVGAGGGAGTGGGGAGAYWYNATFPVSVGSYTVTIGAGGVGGNNVITQTAGGSSVFGTITAAGGGKGGLVNENGGNGGSGGGAGGSAAAKTGGTGTAGHGNNGGSNAGTAAPQAAAGGGGAGAVGANTVSNIIAGNGGAGTSNSISGASVCYAGGGGGGVANGGGTPGTATCGGGNGDNSVGVAGTANTGGGGGGGGQTSPAVGGHGGSGIVIVRYLTTPGPPNPITTLASSNTDDVSTVLSWTAPGLNGGTLQNYVLNYTTPCGTPLTPMANGTTATSYTVSGLSASTCYSFRASAATEGGTTSAGANIVNVTTLAFNPANYTIGSFDYNTNNPVRLPIRYERIDNGTQTLVNVTFSSTVNLACDLRYTYAMTNQTYHTIPYSTISSTEKESSFQFTNSSNDIVTFHCWDQAGNQSANYVLTQTDFLLLQQVREFRNGTYGTMGQIGAFDFISLVVVIIAMIGFNQKNESVAGFFCIVAISVMAYFNIVSWITAVVAGAAVIIMLIVASTRKE